MFADNFVRNLNSKLLEYDIIIMPIYFGRWDISNHHTLYQNAFLVILRFKAVPSID